MVIYDDWNKQMRRPEAYYSINNKQRSASALTIIVLMIHLIKVFVAIYVTFVCFYIILEEPKV